MYVAVASFSSRWVDKDLDKIIKYVDKQNNNGAYNKYFVVELNDRDWGIYQKSRQFQGCTPTIVYDPFNVGERYIRASNMYSNGFVRTFGSRSGDH